MSLVEPQPSGARAAWWRRSGPTARTRTADGLAARALPSWLPVAAAIVLFFWIALVAVRGVLLAREAIDLALARAARTGRPFPEMAILASLIVGICLLTALVTRRLWPPATLPVTFALGGGVLVVAAVNTATLASVLVVLAILVIAWLLGDALVARLPLTDAPPVVRLPLAVAFGLGILGLLLFPLAVLGWLTAPVLIGGTTILLLGTLAVDQARLRADVARVRGWRPGSPTWLETVVVGLSTGLVAYMLLAVFVPEILADATRTHLPIAREIWQAGSITSPAITASRETLQAHLHYAVVWGFGAVTAIKLLNAAVGLTTALGVAAIAWLVSGRVAAVVGAALFLTIPIVGWQLGHAFDDVFPVLYAVASILCLLLWQREGARVWVICAGLLAGFGAATKLTAALMIVALAAAIFLVGRGPWQWRERVETALLFALGAGLVVAPWLLRTYQLTGSLSPDLERLAGALGAKLFGSGRVASQAAAVTGATPLDASGPTNSLVALLRGPWDLTFHAESFLWASLETSPIGIALLMLLPLALFAPRTRATALLTLTLVLSYVGWWFSLNQIVRHLMPTLAIAAVLAGIGVASIVKTPVGGQTASRRLVASALMPGIMIALVGAGVAFVPAERTRLAVDVLTGRETAAAYVQREVHLAPLLAETTRLLPPDTLVGYTGTAGPGFYTEARLVYLRPDRPPGLGSTPEEVLANLDRQGIDYVIWDRIISPGAASDWPAILLSTEFLRAHTRILAGGSGGYLFEILSDDNRAWGQPRLRNLLRDPRLRSAETSNGAWQSSGKVKAKRLTVKLMPKSSLVSRRAVVNDGHPYLLSVIGRCADAKDDPTLALRWFDAHGAELSVDQEAVIFGTKTSEQFLWRRAPEGAAVVEAEIALGGKSHCEFKRAELYSLS